MNSEKYLQTVAEDVVYCANESDKHSFKFGKFGTTTLVEGLMKTVDGGKALNQKLPSTLATAFHHRLANLDPTFRNAEFNEGQGVQWRRLLYDLHATLLSIKTCLNVPFELETKERKSQYTLALGKEHLPTIANIADRTQDDNAFALDQIEGIFNPKNPLHGGLVDVDQQARISSYIIYHRKDVEWWLRPHIQIVDFGISLKDGRAETVLATMIQNEMIPRLSDKLSIQRVVTTRRLNHISNTGPDWKKIVADSDK